MNIKKELVKTFKNLLGVYFGKVYSNEELKISDKSIGGKVEAIQADGSLAPVEDGDIVMQDGFAFTVKDGVITSIVGQEPVEAKEETDEQPSSGTTEVDQAEVVEEIPEPEAQDENKVDERLKALEDAVDEIKSMLESASNVKMESAKAIEAFEATVKELNYNILALAKVPVEFSKTSKSNVVEESKEEKLFAIASMIGAINKK